MELIQQYLDEIDDFLTKKNIQLFCNFHYVIKIGEEFYHYYQHDGIRTGFAKSSTSYDLKDLYSINWSTKN